MKASKSNRTTVEAYNREVATYVKTTPLSHSGMHNAEAFLSWVDGALAQTKPGGQILELGSAIPREAQYMRRKGFKVQCSDAAEQFVRSLRALGEPAISLNVIEDTIPGMYDLIFANSVFPHFTHSDALAALRNIHRGLAPGGTLAFNVKEGEGHEWTTERFPSKRYIRYWLPNDIYHFTTSCGFEIISLEYGVQGKIPTHIWTRIIAQKK